MVKNELRFISFMVMITSIVVILIQICNRSRFTTSYYFETLLDYDLNLVPMLCMICLAMVSYVLSYFCKK